jgi:5'(3')-deoxyribonucleotidase
MKANKKLTLIVDLDDTLNNLVNVWVEFYNEKFGTKLTIEDFKEWDISKTVKNPDEMFLLLNDPKLHERLKRQPFAFETLYALHRRCYDIHIVTATRPQNILAKIKFCEKSFGFIDTNKIAMVYHKDIIVGDIMIDDNPDNLSAFKGLKILLDKPWNRSCDKKDIIRVKDWVEILSVINEWEDKNWITKRNFWNWFKK